MYGEDPNEFPRTLLLYPAALAVLTATGMILSILAGSAWWQVTGWSLLAVWFAVLLGRAVDERRRSLRVDDDSG